MALINCPECNRENVSDAAESCPSCGFGIKAHFEAIKKKADAKKWRESFERSKIEEAQNRLNKVEMPDKPHYPIWTIVCAVAVIGIGIPSLNVDEWDIKRSISQGHGDPRITFPVMLIWGIAFISIGIYMYSKKRTAYKLSQENPDAYRHQVISNEDAAIASARQSYNGGIKCPNCGRPDASKLSVAGKAVSIGAVGLASNKIGKSYKCNSCGYIW